VDTLVDVVRVAHALAGAVALGSMVGPMVTRKGGVAHRRWGRVFAFAMAGVVVLAWAVCLLRVVRGEHVSSSVFLAMVGLLAGACTWAGWRVRAEKGRVEAHTDPLDRGVMMALGLAGAAGLGFGLYAGEVLFGVFGALCLWTARNELRAMALVEPGKWHWWYRHMSSMLAACIATVTAFLVVNVPGFPSVVRELLPPWGWWVLPTVIGTPGIIVWTAIWHRRLEGGDGSSTTS
jgi:hypothetical protein